MSMLEARGFGICRCTGGSVMKGTISSVTVSSEDCVYVKPGYHVSAWCSVSPMHDCLFFNGLYLWGLS